jgi:hypothetical protein
MQGPGRELRQSRFNFLGVTDQDQLGMISAHFGLP